MRLLDLFCGGFGAGEGYRRAGWDVTGWDMVERKGRPPGVAFVKGDVREALADLDYLQSFDLIHASPPCKVHTRLAHLREAQGGKPIHGDMVDETRRALTAAGVPFILENVEGAPLQHDVILCGTMFRLTVTDSQGATRWLRRHRIFELGGWGAHGWDVQPEPCCTCQSGCSRPLCGHRAAGDRPLGVYGSLDDRVPDGGQTAESLAQANALMGTPWMSWRSVTQAIPPAYTEYLGRRALEHLT